MADAHVLFFFKALLLFWLCMASDHIRKIYDYIGDKYSPIEKKSVKFGTNTVNFGINTVVDLNLACVTRFFRKNVGAKYGLCYFFCFLQLCLWLLLVLLLSGLQQVDRGSRPV